MNLKQAAILSLMIPLTACGANKNDRLAGGALIGAGAGAVVGSVFAAPVYGAMIGAGLGGATGATTTQKQIDLGKPWWNKPMKNKKR